MIKYNISIYTKSGFPYGLAPENFVRQMALGLKYNNQNVKIVLCQGHRENIGINDTGILYEYLFFKVKPKNELFKIIELIGYFFQIPLFLLKDKLKNKTDFIILYGIEYFYLTFPIWCVTKILKIKLFRIVTDIYDKSTIVPVWWKTPKYFFYNLQAKWFDKKFDGIICVSNFLYNKYLENKNSKNKLIIIPHFIDIDSFRIHSLEQKKENEIKRIGYCGTVIPKNGIFELIKAVLIVIKEISNIELLIIGQVPNQYLKQIEKIINGVEKHFIFLGQKTKDEIPKLLNSCDILVNPRKSGTFAEAGFPTKLGEYLACNRPVVATKVGDINLYFENKKELLLAEPDSPLEMAEKIKWLIENPTERDIIAANGFKWAKENLDYIISAKKLINFINSL